jgi:glycosyltransferase involved in cell wall biosynthesis
LEKYNWWGKVNLFISLDLGTNSSGNIVSTHELEFLKSISDNVIQLGYEEISPTKYGLPDNPFMIDYLAMNKASQIDLSNISIAHTYAGSFTNTIRYLKAKGIKVTSTVDAHNREESIKEFHNLGYDYPFKHVSDDKLWKLYSDFTRETDIIIVPSKISKEILIQEGVKEDNIKIIAHGTDIPIQDKIKPINESQFNVGFLGNHGPDKGLRYLIEAMSQLNYQDSTLLIAGRGTEQLEPFIKKYATTGKFHLMGWVENKEDFFNNISVYVQPSVTEAFSIEIPEAMTYGRPVICSNGAGAADCIEHGETGFIVDKRDVKGLANKIDWFRSHEQELYLMGGRCKEVVKKYNWSIIRQQYIDLWKSL